ncbi:ABC transporter substrate-binding protein [Flavobacteriaceae bacterium 3-367]|uniref:ABC transporter substrate-binding protein n=1 Tax=Eudoraea algarum TaxID=3417568 RepID=UPI00327C8FBB
MKNTSILLFLFILFACKQEKKEGFPVVEESRSVSITHAKGFRIEHSGTGLTLIKITSPWPNSETAFTYALVPKEKMASISLSRDAYDAIVAVPVEHIVVTSTTHIPALEALGVADRLVGFPQTDFISSDYTRKRIDQGKVQELGSNENINTERVIALNPEVVVGFGINNKNNAYTTLKKSRVPVVYNGDWTEETPLGKAEWVKFFAPFFGLEKEADSIFGQIESAYNDAKSLGKKAGEKPTVLTGGLFKDVWYVAGGKSWMARFLEDAHTQYLWNENQETGSLSLSLESVLDRASEAEFWLNPSMLTSYDAMNEANKHYQEFGAFKNKKVYSNTIAKGATGGLLFYEQAPNRPDLVLKDLIHIFHPELLPDHVPVFFKPLN